MWVDAVFLDVSFFLLAGLGVRAGSRTKAELLLWKQNCEAVPAPCPAGPGGTLKEPKKGS